MSLKGVNAPMHAPSSLRGDDARQVYGDAAINVEVRTYHNLMCTRTRDVRRTRMRAQPNRSSAHALASRSWHGASRTTRGIASEVQLGLSGQHIRRFRDSPEISYASLVALRMFLMCRTTPRQEKKGVKAGPLASMALAGTTALIAVNLTHPIEIIKVGAPTWYWYHSILTYTRRICRPRHGYLGWRLVSLMR